MGGADIPYFVTGSVASVLYGEPRLTHDIDLVLRLVLKQVRALQQAFPDDLFYCPPREVLESEANRPSRGHFNLIHYETGFRGDVYLLGSDPLHRWAMERRRQFRLGNEPIWVAPPEYVIVRKLEYYREGGSQKHLHDIAGMLSLSADDLDAQELERWIKSRGLEKEWGEVGIDRW